MSDTNLVQEKSTPKVWVFIVDRKGGTDVSVHATELDADAANWRYCDQFWHDEFGKDTPKPATAEEVVDEYWQRMSERGEEWHMLEECEIEGQTVDADLISRFEEGLMIADDKRRIAAILRSLA